MGDRMNDVIVRPAEERDLGPMCGLLQELFSIEQDFQVEPARQRRGLESLLARDNSALMLVADAGGTAIGMCTAQVLISTAEGGPVALVEDVVVTQSWRGQGIGARLLAAVDEWARERGLRRLQLLADRTNGRAIDFYVSKGWQCTRMVALRRHP